MVKGSNALPPEDRLLKFLVENSTESVVQCANCEMECKTQVGLHCAAPNHTAPYTIPNLAHSNELVQNKSRNTFQTFN